jgi:8-oxo-dGTP pyrophosphatase MutT (NUDIX family)
VDGRVLLVRQKDGKNTFLPGGHIDPGEKAESALVREIEEETGMSAVVKSFVGAVEHRWTENGQENHEINLVFEAAVPGLDPGAPPESLESRLEFIWSGLEDLESLNLQPYPLVACLKGMDKGYSGFWGSSLEERE